MHLQGDKTFGRHVVDEIRHRNTVKPGFYRRPDTFDAVVVPLTVFEGRLSVRIQIHRIKPATTGFVINTGAPGTVGRIHFALVAMYPSIHIIRKTLTAELHA